MTNEGDPKQKFSKVKTELKPGEFEDIVDYQKTKAKILENRDIVMSSEIAKRREGIFRFPNFEKFFSLDGSITMKERPDELFYLNFFRKPGRVARKEYSYLGKDENGEEKRIEDNTYYLRGERYLASVNPNLDTLKKVDILLEDYIDGLLTLSNGPKEISTNELFFKQELAIMDYIKNASITFLNALIQYEKEGVFRLDDTGYQSSRKLIMDISKRAVRMYYAYVTGNKDDYISNLKYLNNRLRDFKDVIFFLKEEHIRGILTNASFSRQEANHPLVIGASVLLNAVNTNEEGINVQLVVGLPSGSTELALAQQYAIKLYTKHFPQVVLMPISLYSTRKLPKRKIAEMNITTNLAYLEQFRQSIDSRGVMLVEDNSSTGSTIQIFYDILIEYFRPKKVFVAVAEAGIIYAKQQRDKKDNPKVASKELNESSVNILPFPKKKSTLEFKARIEKQRLIKECKIDLSNARGVIEKMMYSIFLRNLKNPTEVSMKKIKTENVISNFEGTVLSNFYKSPINYGGKQYSSLEKAYQAEKFLKEESLNIPENVLVEIINFFRKDGMRFDGDLIDFFSSEYTSSRTSRGVGDILRKNGLERPEWQDIKVKILLELLLEKFKDPDILKQLKNTGDKYLVDGNDGGDIFWGVDTSGKNPIGKNILGLALMYVRDELNK